MLRLVLWVGNSSVRLQNSLFQSFDPHKMPYERRVVVTWQTLTAFAEQSEQFSFRSHSAKRRGAKGGGTTYQGRWHNIWHFSDSTKSRFASILNERKTLLIMELTAFQPAMRWDAQFFELVTAQLSICLTLAPCLWKGNSSGCSGRVTRRIRRTVGLSVGKNSNTAMF